MAQKMLERVLPEGHRTAETVAARESFWAYCKLMNPRFFKDNRPHLKELADTLQALDAGTLLAPDGSVCKRLAINEPSRHGKSYTMNMFNQWCFGKNPVNESIINVSYNEKVSTVFSRRVRNAIDATKLDPKFTIFSDVFPGVKIKYGEAAADMWSLEGSFFSFLGAGMGGTVTGIGCKKLVVDDPIKNSIEANNDNLLEEIWDYYTDTLLSRLEEGGLIILIMTRWNTRDLVGRALDAEPGKWHVLNHKACLDEKEGRMLCPDLLSFESYQDKKKLMSPEIFMANFQGEPIDANGRLYAGFATYGKLPETKADGQPIVQHVTAYVDTADTGDDFLCAVIADVIEGEGFMRDTVYTDEPMEATELAVAKALYQAAVNECYIESNNGGRGFARNVERILWERYHWRRTTIIWVAQRQNKIARIRTESPFVMNHICMPEDWATRWPMYYNAMRNYQNKGKNAHDDAPDATTGLAEVIQRGGAMRKKFYSGRGKRR
jgi:predicted phage terminase large subunit-like protein